MTISEEIYDSFLTRIRSGEYQVGENLPPVRLLAKSFSCSIAPVYSALARLEQEGFLKSYHGSGVRVESSKPMRRSARMNPIVDVVTSMEPAELVNLRPSRGLHHLDVIQQSLISSLSGNPDIRITLSSFFNRKDGIDFRVRVEDALQLRPAVFVFAKPEWFQDDEEKLLRELRGQGTYVVYYAARRMVEEFDRVVSDFASGQAQITSHFLGKGKRRFLRFATSMGHLYEKQKQLGFEQALKAAGFSSDQAGRFTVECPDLPDRNWQQVDYMTGKLREILNNADLPEVIFAATDAQVASTRLALRFLNIRGIEVAGYDNNWSEFDENNSILQGVTSGHFPEELSAKLPPVSVDTLLPEMGAALADIVIKRAMGKLSPESQVVIVPQKLVLPQAG